MTERQKVKPIDFEKELLLNTAYNLSCNYHEIGNNALEWKVSSAQNGYGVQQLRDNNLATFWQFSKLYVYIILMFFLFDSKH